jgi:hypothetical protein
MQHATAFAVRFAEGSLWRDPAHKKAATIFR